MNERTQELAEQAALLGPTSRVGNAHEAAEELRRLHDYKSAYEIWSEKTNWVQDSSQSHELGKHRADVLKDRIDRLYEVNQELVEALEEIAEWTERYTSAGHPISTVARAILAKHKEQV